MELDDDQGWSTQTRGGEGIIPFLKLQTIYDVYKMFRIKKFVHRNFCWFKNFKHIEAVHLQKNVSKKLSTVNFRKKEWIAEEF